MELLQSIGRRLWHAAQGFSSHEGMLAAAAIAYSMALSFFPMLLVLVAGLGWVLQWTDVGQAAQVELLAAIEQQASPQLAEQVRQMLKVVGEGAGTGGPIGFAMLLVSSLIIFAQIDTALDRIFHTPSAAEQGWLPFLWSLVFQRIKALVMLIGVGGFILLVMVSTMILTATLQYAGLAPHVAAWADWLTGMGVNLALDVMAFTMIYKVVPKPYIRWREAVQGGIAAALLWEVGRQALAMYLLRANYQDAYGVIGSFLIVMLWAYYGSLVILFGAEYVRATRDATRQSS